jgi:hypothetical protein
MTFGPHSRLVYEFLHWIDQQELLQYGGTPPHQMLIVSGFENALSIARHTALGGVNWTSLRENTEALLYQSGLLDTGPWMSYKDNIKDLLYIVEEKTTAIISDRYCSILDDVIADLHVLACCLAIHGELDPFYEMVWQAYKSGGWPCGCTGGEPTPDDYIYNSHNHQFCFNIQNRQLFMLWETGVDQEDIPR